MTKDRLPVCMVLTTKPAKRRWQGHFPALSGTLTHTHPHNVTLRYTNLQSNKVYLHIKPSGTVQKSLKHTIKYEHYIHPAACSSVQCSDIILICDNEKLCVKGILCFTVMSGSTTHHLPLSVSQCVCVLPRGNYRSFIMCVCALVPSDIRVYP